MCIVKLQKSILNVVDIEIKLIIFLGRRYTNSTRYLKLYLNGIPLTNTINGKLQYKCMV